VSQCSDVQFGGITGLNEPLCVKDAGFPYLMFSVLVDYCIMNINPVV